MLMPDLGPTETVVKSHTCEYHKKNPSHRSYAGCTCWSSYALVSVPKGPKKFRQLRRLRDDR